MNQPPGQGPYGSPPPQSSYGSQFGQGQAPPGGAYGSAAYAPPREAQQAAAPVGSYGDKAFEHRMMKRGRFTAWPYVVIAFLMEAAFIGCAFGMPAGMVAAYLTKSHEAVGIVTAVIGLPAGLGGAYFVFRDRWRCNEAFSSRFCVGIMNVSLLFVPLIAFVYANVRGIRKLGGT